jgi:hypothetical protein
MEGIRLWAYTTTTNWAYNTILNLHRENIYNAINISVLNIKINKYMNSTGQYHHRFQSDRRKNHYKLSHWRSRFQPTNTIPHRYAYRFYHVLGKSQLYDNIASFCIFSNDIYFPQYHMYS